MSHADSDGRRPLRKASVPRAEPGPPSSEVRNLAASFPLIFFGAGCIAIAAILVSEGSRTAIDRTPLWIPFLALGLIALFGATLSVFAVPDEGAEATAAVVSTTVRSGGPSHHHPPHRPPRSRSPAAANRPAVRPAAAATLEPTPLPIPVPLSAPRGEDLGPALTAAPAPRAGELTTLFDEIDLIEADLRSTRPPSPPSLPRSTVTPTKSVRTGAPWPPPVPGTPARTPAALATPPQVGPPGVVRRAPVGGTPCVGCSSTVPTSPTRWECRVCHEPLCPDCHNWSLAEGMPNVCPLCYLQGDHSRGAPASLP